MPKTYRNIYLLVLECHGGFFSGFRKLIIINKGVHVKARVEKV